MKIGVISDTHGVFSDEFKRFLDPVDEIWHAGDFGGGIDFVHSISAFKPLVGVYGNCDAQEIRFECPLTQLFNCEGLKVLMTHIGGYPGNYDARIRGQIYANPPQLFIAGHSHILKVKFDKTLNLLHINPGAAGLQGWHKERTLIRLTIEGNKMTDCEVITFNKKE